MFIGLASQKEKRKPVAAQSEIGNLRRLQLKLQFVSDKGDEFRIGRLTLCIADGIAEKSLQSVQVASVPGYFNGVADGTLYTGRRGLESLCHLGVQDFRDGVDNVHIVHGNDDCLPQVLIALNMGRDTDQFIALFMA